jgi:hypothetical protein
MIESETPASVGAFFWAVADGGINLDRAGWLSDSRRPGEPLPETDGQAGRGFSYGLAHVVNSRREGMAVDFKRCLSIDTSAPPGERRGFPLGS